MAENLLDKQEKSAAQLERDLILWLVDPDGSGDRDYWAKLRSIEQFLGGTVGVTQTAHGFSVGDVLSHDGTAYVEATADTSTNARAVAVVVDVPDADSFLLRSDGFVTGLSGLTGGSWHYLQDAGGLGTSPGTVEVPVLRALSSTEAWLLPLGFPGGGSGVSSMNDLNDVDAASPSDGQVLTWVEASSAWEPTAASGVSNFTGLNDTPGSYASGDAGKHAVVNSAENALEFVDAPLQSFVIACSDETTDLSTGTAKVTFRMPYAFTVTEVRASVTTAPTGSALQVDINEAGTSILSTEITIDAGEATSETAATAAVISDSALADDAEVTIDIDAVGSTTPGTGLKVTIIGRPA